MRFYVKRKFVLFALIAISICFSSFAQDSKKKSDSLKTILTQTISDTQKVNILVRLAGEIDCNDTTTKLYYANQAETLAEKKQWAIGLIKSGICLGNIFFVCTKNYNKALIYYLRTDTLARKINDNASEIISLNNIANIYQYTGKYRQAIDCYTQLLTVSTNADITIEVWGNLGVEYNSLGDYNKALNSYYNSLRLLTATQHGRKNDIQDTIQFAGLLINISDVYVEMSQPDKAFENYDSVYKIGVIINYKVLQIIGLMGMGEIYQIKEDYQKSIIYYQKALKDAIEERDFINEIKILNKLATAYIGIHDLPKAMEYAQNSLKLAEKQANNEQLPKAYITLGKVYMKQLDYNNAVNYLQKALAISGTTGALDDQKDAWGVLSSTYEKMNQPAMAFDAYKNYISIRDSVYNIAKAKEFARQEIDFSYKEQQAIDQQKIARQQAFIYSVLGGIALVILLAFFIYRNYHTQKKYNELLSRDQQRHLAQIEAQDTVLTDIAHIQSHQVRGPVATILGLVKIYNHDDPTDPMNEEIIGGLEATAEKLDMVIKEVVHMENNLKREQSAEDKKAHAEPLPASPKER